MAQHPQAHVLQTEQWGTLKSRFGWSDERVLLTDPSGAIRAGALLLFRRLFRWKSVSLNMAYIPKGPLVDWRDRDTTTELLQHIEARSRARGASVLKIEPDLPDTPANRALLQGYGFRPSIHPIQPQSTLVLDIGDSEKAILGRMKSKWRYNVRLSQRKGVTVRRGTREDMAHFGELMQVTGSRKEFSVHSAGYYQTAFDLFVPEQAAFLFAEYQGSPLAALAVFALGDTAWYLWGASSNRERNRMPNHALQWAAIQWARERGATRYDLWGIPDDVGKLAVGLAPDSEEGVPAEALPIDLNQTPHSEMWGVYRLKQGFGGNVVRFVGAWDKPLHPVGFRVYHHGFQARTGLVAAKAQLLDAASQSRERLEESRARLLGEDSVLPSEPEGLRARVVADPGAWQKVLATWPHPHVLQSWAWGEVKAQTDWRAERFQLRDESGATRAAFQILWRRPLRGLPVQIAYVPKGPLLDWQDPELVEDVLVEDVLAYIERLTRARRALFVKIDPDVREDAPAGRALLQRLRAHGWRFSSEQIQFKNTAFTDLPAGEETSGDEEPGEKALLAEMKSKWRYNIRLATRRGIRVRTGGRADLRTFYELYRETGQRDGFLIRPFAYYETVWTRFLQAQARVESGEAEDAGGALLLAEHEDERAPVAGLFLLRYGATTWYFYGASSEQRRRDMPNYLLQWEAMRWARAQGCTRYDWWGAPTNVDDDDDPMSGVWRFKAGFGAQFQPHIGAWDWAPAPLLYRLYGEAMPRLLDAIKRLRA